VLPLPRNLRRVANAFVVQQHQASTLHYDFRLEVGGVLRSWAVPKGPSMNPADKRLAVEVEDHSIQWGSFEGRIGEGYGEGAVIVWDRGTYEPLDDEGMEAALEQGKASFRLDGEKLRGGFTLVRTRGSERKPQWLLIKKRDEEADGEGPVGDRPESVVSGKTLEELD
jgi:bifunctional non-homologous end joining protein LigD